MDRRRENWQNQPVPAGTAHRTCGIPDMTGLPGLSELKPDDVPMRVELLIRKASPLLEYPEYSEEVKKKTDRKSDLMKEGVFVWIMFTSGEESHFVCE